VTEYFTTHIVEPGKLALFLMFVAFIVTFLFIRFSVRMIRAGVSWWPGNVQPGGLHVHHVVFGLVFMLIAGVLAFAPVAWESPWWEIVGALFGVGAALVLDEFALILHLDDVYWSEQGRKSIDVVVLSAALVGMLVLGASPLGVSDVSEAEESLRWGWIVTVVTNAAFVLITLLKGRFWLGVLGLLLPLLALIGTFLIAKPDSPWARRRYREGSRKRARSVARAARHDARWRQFKHRVFDAVAGRPDAPALPDQRPGDHDAVERAPARRDDARG
jgi:hypothetical protein